MRDFFYRNETKKVIKHRNCRPCSKAARPSHKTIESCTWLLGELCPPLCHHHELRALELKCNFCWKFLLRTSSEPSAIVRRSSRSRPPSQLQIDWRLWCMVFFKGSFSLWIRGMLVFNITTLWTLVGSENFCVLGQIKSEWIYEGIGFPKYQLKKFKDLKFRSYLKLNQKVVLITLSTQ